MVRKLNSKAEFDELLSSGKPFVVDFYASWCGPCKHIAPEIEKLANAHLDIEFVKVDVDDEEGNIEALATEYKVNAMPTFLFFTKSKQITSVVGANLPKVKECINQLLSQK